MQPGRFSSYEKSFHADWFLYTIQLIIFHWKWHKRSRSWHRGAFTNYVYKIWLFLTTYLPPLTFSMVQMFVLTTYPPSLVNVVCERPLVLDTHSRQFSKNTRIQCVSSINVKWGCGIFIWEFKIGKFRGTFLY